MFGSPSVAQSTSGAVLSKLSAKLVIRPHTATFGVDIQNGSIF